MNLENDEIIKLLRKTGSKIYLVGGAVRDVFLKRENHDKDIIVLDTSAHDFAGKFARENSAIPVCLDRKNNIFRVVMKDKINYVDITNPVNNSLDEDLKRRDLTINAAAMEINTGKIYDPLNGLEDIKNGIIRAISEDNFINDPLRMLRAYRFASVLGFKIENQTRVMIRKHLDLILTPAVERRNSEILKLFGGKFADEILKITDDDGIIELLFPIMKDVKKVPSNTHHHLDLFHHSIETVKQIQSIYETSRIEVKEHLESIPFGVENRLSHLKLAGFLHDIGKFSTWTIEENGRHRFIGHDETGASKAQSILTKSKFSKKQVEYITFLIRYHIYPSSVVSAPNLSDKIFMRYIRRTRDRAVDLITLAKADRLSARGVMVTDEMVRENITKLNSLQDFYIKIKPTLKPLPKLLTGNDIMKIRKMKPSRELGEIIDALNEAQSEGKISTVRAAIKFVKSYKLN